MPDHSAQVVITVNGPGEVAGWLYPLSVELKRRYPQVRIVACVVPCVFSTGAETDVLRALRHVDAVCSTRQTLSMILRGRLPDAIAPDLPTLVFHMGGDVTLSLALGWRLKATKFAYVEVPIPMNRFFDKLFYNGLTPVKGASEGGTVGELMVDAAALRRAETAAVRDASAGKCIALYPGSRSYMAEFLLPYYAVTVDALSARRPGLEWVMARADFISMAYLRDFPQPPQDRTWQAHPLSFDEDETGAWLQTPAGNRIRILDGPKVLGLADLALTIPGTNTGELAASGVPMVVVVPTYLGHKVPLPGIAGHLGKLPLVGRLLKLAFGWARVRKLGLMAQPNVRAGRQIVPEFVGEGLHGDIQAALEQLLDSDTAALSDEIRATMGQPGAARALAGEIAAHFNLADPA